MSPYSGDVKQKEVPRDFPSHSTLKNGWYSEERARKGGSVVYLHATTGEEVTITEISSYSTPCYTGGDVRFVGIIDGNKYVRGEIH